MPQLLVTLIACLLMSSSNSFASWYGQAEVVANSDSSSRTEVPNCAWYIAAYGVSVAQYQRIENNWKKFQSVCRAPSPASVDSVVIFTHDTDFYKDTLPGAVHTDKSGFSDWTAIVLLDNTQAQEKFKREYVWIFRFKEGTLHRDISRKI